MTRNSKVLTALLLLCMLVASVSSFPHNGATSLAFFSKSTSSSSRIDTLASGIFDRLRGGSTVEVEEEAKEMEDDEDEEADDQTPSIMSAQPVRLLIQTNWGNSVLDHRVELMAARTRDIAWLKKSVSRQLPGRPPVLGLELVYEGSVLDDEMLVDELMEDDEDEDDDDQDENEAKVLILNVIPPVDSKFATELYPKVIMEDDDDRLTTEELVDAYFLNQAALARNSVLLTQPSSTPSSPLLRLEMQEQARLLREQLQSQIPAEVWEASMQPAIASQQLEQRRGQRYRSGKGGARTSLRKSIQHNMNINWPETIRNFILFLFFGYFGGRNSLSRYVMLLGAPLCFISQARPVKIWSKQLFFMFMFPPSIVLSLLPAPEQAILNMDVTKAYGALYAPEEQVATKKPAAVPEIENVEEVQVVEEEEAEEDVEDESESELEESDEEESESISED